MSRLRGVAQTKAALAAIQARIEAASPEAVQQGGERVASRMRSIAPRDTGRLASQIGVDVSSLGDGATAKVGSDAPYDRFVQSGTVHMTAQPYGTDAGEEATSQIVAAMIAVYRAALP